MTARGKSPVRLFSSLKKAEKTLERTRSRAERDYRPLYKDGRANALERAEAVAIEKLAEEWDEAQVEKDQVKLNSPKQGDKRRPKERRSKKREAATRKPKERKQRPSGGRPERSRKNGCR